MENSVKERLICFIKHIWISKNKFEIDCGLSKRYVSNIRVSIQPNVIEKIALVYPDLNAGWLLTGEGEMLRENTIHMDKHQITVVPQKSPGKLQESVLIYNIEAKMRCFY